ncbi:C4-dicarboxylate ABC transporter substrate-binding protein [Sphaerisporangium melleum]|uniref:C4-dicarboxylate ABC transporter substrate-binding protein n=1 Tax=Sphaerisporangium melleum TaxID=321316 RepID=A0A917VTE1_9ACTN|nr:TAXI family TRAP transporter solute-binding subunit [Sphaerisporangium melleum]GGL12351.1 C4-dicarboxylate ABC transporter substrate-binding protein [Sphaerisporangium melleum]GII74476.1 C4-dicarboxylate ABC transporter substrate-binding protein [Sphaerisporangium melleum]
MTRSFTRLAAVAVGLVLALAACGGERRTADEEGVYKGGRLSIATGNTTGVYYQLGGGYADLIGRNLPGYQVTAEATGASVENIQRVVRGDSDIAFTLADAAGDAATGKGAFSAPQPIRALARIYTNYTHVIARADAGIRSVADMKGKRVSTGSPNSGTEYIALRLLRAAGVDPDTGLRKQALSLPETVQGIKDGTLDALFWSGGLPTGGVTDLVTTLKQDVVFVPLDDLLPKLRSEYGEVYQAGSIGKAVYGTGDDVATIAVPNLLVVSDKMPAGLAGDLARILFDHQQELVKVHPEAGNMSKADAPKTAPVPLHDGAKKYFTGG